ncbi:hypothetical protein E3J68_01995 [Candidatus Aerophobetes bacterium]|uniref:Uncharacterized protein n=1 Tax=Aerophobetes bacterium TaxID=2030807 RepID=A0A523TG23_UNCAE|nr:MAG: hypothetical protein E3J68_01995 [Candidatus Aerophobetes bacterium]
MDSLIGKLDSHIFLLTRGSGVLFHHLSNSLSFPLLLHRLHQLRHQDYSILGAHRQILDGTQGKWMRLFRVPIDALSLYRKISHDGAHQLILSNCQRVLPK